MQVDVINNEANGPKSIVITDGTETLSMIVKRDQFGTRGDLKTADGQRTWNHCSLAEINLLIHRARSFVTVKELTDDLGMCDEERLLKCLK